jgi:hypothetical protein
MKKTGLRWLSLSLGEEFAHGLNERIRVKEFYNGLIFWDVLIKALAG